MRLGWREGFDLIRVGIVVNGVVGVHAASPIGKDTYSEAISISSYLANFNYLPVPDWNAITEN